MTDLKVELTQEDIGFLMGGIMFSMDALERGLIPMDKCILKPQEIWLLIKKLQGMPPAVVAQLRAGIDAQTALNESIKKAMN